MRIRYRLPRWALITGFGLALGFTLIFAAKMLLWARDERDGAAVLPVAGWMPIGFLARSRDIPREVLLEAAGIEPGERARLTLAGIARQNGEPLEALVIRIEASIASWQARGND